MQVHGTKVRHSEDGGGVYSTYGKRRLGLTSSVYHELQERILKMIEIRGMKDATIDNIDAPDGTVSKCRRFLAID